MTSSISYAYTSNLHANAADEADHRLSLLYPPVCLVTPSETLPTSRSTQRDVSWTLLKETRYCCLFPTLAALGTALLVSSTLSFLSFGATTTGRSTGLWGVLEFISSNLLTAPQAPYSLLFPHRRGADSRRNNSRRANARRAGPGRGNAGQANPR